MKRFLVIACGLLAACLGDPVGPRGTLLLRAMAPDTSTMVTGAPGRLLPTPVAFEVVDDGGRPIPGARIAWRTSGVGSAAVVPVTVSDGDGRATAGWVLGTNAQEPQQLVAEVIMGSHRATLTVNARAVPVEVAALSILAETTLVRLGVPDTLRVIATDPFGNLFLPSDLRLAAGDTSIAQVDSTRAVIGRQRGFVRVAVEASGVVDSAWVHVTQVVTEIRADADSLRFHSLGQEQGIAVGLWDDQGNLVVDSFPSASVVGSGVVELQPGLPYRLRSLANGSAQFQLSVGGVTRTVELAVSQIADSISAAVVFNQPIVTLPVGAPLPIVCTMFDANRFPIAAAPDVVPSGAQTVTAGPCGQQAVSRSGWDTLRVSSGPVGVEVPVVVAAAPIVSSAVGQYIVVDSFPSGTFNGWAPTLHRSPTGALELYTAAFTVLPDSSGRTRSHLHRFVQDGGTTFRYDGIAIRHDDDICSPQGQGIENMTVVPRSDAAGWRMFYAAGSNQCYGWQVFSAVSSDQRTWVKEPGIRIDNGGDSSFFSAIWPAGEGMVVDLLPSGEWRMIVSTYERVMPPESKWQITEWRSADQLTWAYVGPVVTTRDMPPEGQASVYSPTIREIGPGLWRMVFTGDNRTTPGGRSRLWSAVSTDRVNWQQEGELMGAAGTDLYYSSLVDETLVFIRRDGAGALRLAMASVQMP